MNLADSSSSSDLVLSVASLAVTLLVGAVGAAIAYVVGFPRRRLYYRLQVDVPLPDAIPHTQDGLVVQNRGSGPSHVHLLEINLISRGRRDIPSSAFDSGRPIEIDTNAQVTAVLEVRSKPESSVTPNIAIDETSLRIGPGLIGKRQEIKITALVDGEHPRLSCQSSLENVQIRRRREDFPDTYSTWRIARFVYTTAALTVGLYGLASALIIFIGWEHPVVGPAHTVIRTFLVASEEALILAVIGFIGFSITMEHYKHQKKRGSSDT
ncbi:MAG TPA: hypothetical protein VIJ82_00620 [Streptosporangiaceae bacterium]